MIYIVYQYKLYTVEETVISLQNRMLFKLKKKKISLYVSRDPLTQNVQRNNI